MSREFDVPIDALWSWLEELERCDVWMRLNPQAKHAALTRDVQTSEVIYGNPWYFFSDLGTTVNASSRKSERKSRNGSKPKKNHSNDSS